MREYISVRYLFAAVLAASLAPSAQQTPHAPARRPQPRAKATVLVVSCDTSCNWTLDGEDEHPIPAGGTARLKVEPGQHVLVATTDDGKDQIKRDFSIEAGGDAEFELKLLRVRIARLKKELAEQEEKIRAFNAADDEKTPEPDQKPAPPTGLSTPPAEPTGQTNQNPAPPDPAAGRLEISSTVASDMLIVRTLPVYPAAARAMGISGTVVLHFTITRDGLVTDLEVVSGPPLLQKAATDAVSTWKFTPYLVNGHAVDVTTRFTIDFKLNSKAPVGNSGPAS
jgi:TonB family protein